MIQDLHRVIELIEGGWERTRLVVLGDVMLDRYIWGDVERISPEAPVPIVRAVHSSERPGGAANVATNLIGLGASTNLFGFRGDDPDGVLLEQSLQASGVESHLLPVPEFPTTTKVRIFGGKQQMMRLDAERTESYPEEACACLLANLRSAVDASDALVLSDYAKGALSETVCREAISMARQRGIPVLVDPKRRNLATYAGATTICPNLNELALASGIPSLDIESLLAAGQAFVSQLGLDSMTVTMSEKGIAVLRQDSRFIAPAQARQVFDVSGAGDTVIATLALAMANGLSMETAAQLANIAAGIVVGKVGTMAVTRNELLNSLSSEINIHPQERVLTLDHLKVRAMAWRSQGQSVVFTNGCFDLLHIGHIILLEAARREGDRLIVGMNSDASVRRLKGPTRPIVGESERARILAALAAVDAVVVFDEPTPLRLIEELRPDVVVKGGDYREETIVGSKEVRSWGGRVKIVPTVEGFSTTKLIAQMQGGT